MLFNSTVFLQFFAAFLLLYFLCRNSLLTRNLLIVAASWLFYGWWDYRFLALLIFSGCFDFAAGLLIARAGDSRRRKAFLAASVAVNLSLLDFFKYFDFFLGSLATLLTALHLPVHFRTLGIILPVGISFYTFQSLSYVIDVYRGQLQPTRSLLQYLAFVSFFPQLVAGPIQRGHQLLPQLARTLTINLEMLTEGLWLILWGLFKKVVVADNLAPLVEMVFDNPASTGPAVLGGTLAFAFQIYCDFSGYSDMARGLARVLGFDVTSNFNLPYFATDPRDFWRRWHITLSSWLRDYLYISLGGNRRGPTRTAVNLLLTMLLGGLWHGAAWNYVLWGAWHGLGLMVTRRWQDRSGGQARALPGWLAGPLTFLFVLFGWLIFRAGSLQRVGTMTAALLHWSAPAWLPHYLLSLSIFVVPLLLVELWQGKTQLQSDEVSKASALAPSHGERAGVRGRGVRTSGYTYQPLAILSAPAWARAGLQGLLVLAILLFWERKTIPFIYFQF
jgi:D-alanyl-lipoteichoic acid acyltransferase DltB (MBOAT superfamily)